MKKQTQKTLFFFLKLAISLGLVLLLIEKVNWSLVGEKLLLLSFPWILLYCFLQLLGNVISAKKWQVIARFKNLSFTLKEAFFVYLSGAFINNFLPGTIGGDTYRGLWLSPRAPSKTVAFSTVVFDRFTGLWITALLGFVFSLFFLPHPWATPLVSITLAFIAAFIILDLLFTFIYKKTWLHPLLRFLPPKIVLFIEEVASFTEPTIWKRASLYSFLFALVGVGLNNYVLFESLGAHVPLLAYFSLIFLVTLVASIPISINNIGIKEWAYVAFFGLVGVSPEIAVTVSLVSRFLQMLLSFIALPYYLHSLHKKRQAGKK